MSLEGIKIIPFAYRHAHIFSQLRNDIDKEAEHVLAKKGERKESMIRLIAKLLVSQRRTITFLAFGFRAITNYKKAKKSFGIS